VRQALHAEFTRLNGEDMVRARLRQYEVAKFYRDNPPKFKEGVGEMTMAIDPFWEKQFRMQFGVEPTRDPTFQKWLRQNGGEQFFVRSVSAKTQVGYVPTPSRCKYRKRFQL
jgi:hypothetical protein